MKKTKTIFAALLLSASMILPQQANAQAPEKMSYQTIVRNASNNLVVSTAVGIQISILQTTANGAAVYVETHAPTTNANGLVSLEIGTGIPSTGTFAAINWATGPYFVKTEIDPSGGSTYTISGTSQLVSVPYALHAKTAGNGQSTGTEAGQMQYWNGSEWLTIAPTTNAGATLQMTGLVPSWAGGTSAAPVLTTTGMTNLFTADNLTSTASSGGDVTSDNGYAIIDRGVCWSTSSNPTIADNITSDGSGTGSFTSSMSGLTWGSIYYLRAYATNAAGTSYGNEITFNSAIGTSYQGGIVAYTLQAGDPGYDANVVHGIIAAPSDQSTGIQWYNGSYTTTGATSEALGNGQANTTAIVFSQGPGSYAAQLCNDLTLGGYSDWYLPSLHESNILYENRDAIGGFGSYYWCSTEYNNNQALIRIFNGGIGPYMSAYKNFIASVRAVRSF